MGQQTSASDSPVEADDELWLDAGQQHAWRRYLETSQLLMAQLDQELRSEHHIGLSEYELLVRLSEREDHSMRMAELATEVAISRSRLTHIVARMELRGLLSRCAAREDGRGVICRMTKAGYALLVQSAPTHVRGVREHFVAPLDAADLEAVGRAMDILCVRLRGARGKNEQ